MIKYASVQRIILIEIYRCKLVVPGKILKLGVFKQVKQTGSVEKVEEGGMDVMWLHLSVKAY